MNGIQNGRTRILKALRGEAGASTAVSPIIFSNYVRKFYHDLDADMVEKTAELYELLGADIIHRNCFPLLYLFVDAPGPQRDAWRVEIETAQEGDNTVWTTGVRTPGGDLRLVCHATPITPNEQAYAYREALVKDSRDLDLVLNHEPRWTAADLDVTPIRRARQAVGDNGIVAPWVQGVFNFAGVFYRNYEDLLMDPHVDAGFYAKLMEHALEQDWSYLELLIEAGADALAYSGNMAGGQVGPSFFESFVLPYERELIRRIHDKGGRVIYHNCGAASSLFELYQETGMDCFESLAQPPEGDTVLSDALRRMQNLPCLAGGIDQKSFMVSATPDDIRRAVGKMLAIMRGRSGYILSTVDYLSEDTPLENIRAFVDAGREFGAA
jgi:uroporphyrinogen decarboxylase